MINFTSSCSGAAALSVWPVTTWTSPHSAPQGRASPAGPSMVVPDVAAKGSAQNPPEWLQIVAEGEAGLSWTLLSHLLTVSALKVPLLRKGPVADGHGHVALVAQGIHHLQALPHRDLVQAVVLLEQTERQMGFIYYHFCSPLSNWSWKRCPRGGDAPSWQMGLSAASLTLQTHSSSGVQHTP